MNNGHKGDCAEFRNDCTHRELFDEKPKTDCAQSPASHSNDIETDKANEHPVFRPEIEKVV